MNADRRKQLGEALSKLNDARIIIEQVRDEEQEAFDNLPESLQNGRARREDDGSHRRARTGSGRA